MSHLDSESASAPRKPTSILIVVVVLTAVIAGLWYGITRILDVTGSVYRQHIFSIDLAVDDVNGPVISPDGEILLYSREGQLWTHDIDESAGEMITGTEGAERPFWSSDAERIGFFRDSAIGTPTLFSISSTGGPAEAIGQLPTGYPYGTTWKPDGSLTIGLTPRTSGYGNAELYSIAAGEENARVHLQPSLAGGESGMMYPSYLPDGSLMYALTTVDGAGAVVVRSGNGQVVLTRHPGETVAFPCYSPSGHIVYQRGFPRSKGIWAVPFDQVTITRTASPFLLSRDGAMPSVSDNGTLTFHIPPGGEKRQLIRVDRTGTVIDTVTGIEEEMDFPALSPDESRVAVSSKTKHNIDIWIHDIRSRRKLRITDDPGLDHFPTWAPSADHVAFSSTRNDGSGIYFRQSDGKGPIRPFVLSPAAWAPMWGRYNALVYQTFEVDTQGDLMYIRPWSNRNPVSITASPGFEATPVLSPDTRYVAFSSDITGRSEIYISRFPRYRGAARITENGGSLPRWSAGSGELFFVSPGVSPDSSAHIVAIPVKTAGSLKTGTAERLFDLGKISSSTAVGSYDVSSDGQRFVVVQSIDQKQMVTIRVARNWHKAYR